MQSNAATRLPMHRRLQAGVCGALQSLPSRAKIDAQGTVVIGWDVRCHWLAGGCDRARVRQRRRELLVWSDVSLAPLTFPSRVTGCYCSRRLDSALQSVHTGSTTGCGRVRRAFRFPAIALLYFQACYDVCIGEFVSFINPG